MNWKLIRTGTSLVLAIICFIVAAQSVKKKTDTRIVWQNEAGVQYRILVLAGQPINTGIYYENGIDLLIGLETKPPAPFTIQIGKDKFDVNNESDFKKAVYSNKDVISDVKAELVDSKSTKIINVNTPEEIVITTETSKELIVTLTLNNISVIPRKK